MSEAEKRQAEPTREYSDERDMERFWAAIEPENEPAKQRWYIPGLLLCVVMSIPWYLPTGHIGRLVGGLPIWIWTSLGCTLGVSILTTIATLRYWKDHNRE